MSDERRRAERVTVNLPAHWEAESARERGTVSDISVTGCFVLTGGETSPGTTIRVALEFPKGRTIELRGEVVYLTEEIGFAVRFTSDDVNRTRLVKFLKLVISKRRACAPSES